MSASAPLHAQACERLGCTLFHGKPSRRSRMAASNVLRPSAPSVHITTQMQVLRLHEHCTSSSVSCHSQLNESCCFQDVLLATGAAFGRSTAMRIVFAHGSPCSESTCSPWTVHDGWSTKWQHSPCTHATSYACICLYVSVYYPCASPGSVGPAAAAVRARRYGLK